MTDQSPADTTARSLIDQITEQLLNYGDRAIVPALVAHCLHLMQDEDRRQGEVALALMSSMIEQVNDIRRNYVQELGRTGIVCLPSWAIPAKYADVDVIRSAATRLLGYCAQYLGAVCEGEPHLHLSVSVDCDRLPTGVYRFQATLRRDAEGTHG